MTMDKNTSRIGKLPIKIPTTVTATLSEDNPKHITVKGPYGVLELQLPENTVGLVEDNGYFIVEPKDDKALHGLYRTLIHNMIQGVSEQFKVILILEGVGYKANVTGNSLVLNLGFSHPVKMDIPKGITVNVVENRTITLIGCDKQELTLFADRVKAWRPPEPYKGKGIRYQNEIVLRKPGKSGKK
jgi:large subunit ribosomal protein L6